MESGKIKRRPKIRSLLMFQIKLGLDTLRDLFLSPISLLFFLLDYLLGYLMGKEKSPGLFRRLMLFGRRTDRWINLFGVEEDEILFAEAKRRSASNYANVDTLFAEIEKQIVEKQAGQPKTSANGNVSKAAGHNSDDNKEDNSANR